MQIRTATTEDITELKNLYYDTIVSINSRDYNAEQIKAWASTSEKTDSVLKKILEQYFIVVQNEDEIITGFASLDDRSGYLDLMYVHKDYQRMGIASLILQSLLERADQVGLTEITTDASITAKPFFEKNDFQVMKEQMVVVKGIEMINFKMLKKK